ncbi:MAG: hypothetical protein RIR10_1347, partial [Planctomycetota bacterium]
MKWIRSLFALAIAGACAVAASRLADTATSQGPTRRLLIAADEIDPDRVDHIELARDGKRFVFERVSANPSQNSATQTSASQATWRQIAPVTHAADAWAVRQFISRVLKAESVRHVAAPSGDASTGVGTMNATLESAGLSPAVAMVTLREAPNSAGARREVVVELGRRSLAGRAFARRAGDPGYDVVESALHELALERDVRDFRRRELFPDLGEVQRVVFESGNNR